MGARLNLVEHNLHEVQVDATRMLFHIPSSSLFASDEITSGVIASLRQGECSEQELQTRLAGRFNSQDVKQTLEELIALEVVSDGRPLTPEIDRKSVV